MSAAEFVIAALWVMLVIQSIEKRRPREAALIICDNLEDVPPEELLRHVCGKCDAEVLTAQATPNGTIENKISGYSTIVLSVGDKNLRDYLLRYCYAQGLRVYVIPSISDVLINGATHIGIDDRQMLYIDSWQLSPDQKFVKRTADIALSAIGLIVCSPLLLIVTILIKLSDSGPAIYKQKRLTLNGREFILYKFRTMKTDAESDGVARLASKDDARLTKIGAKLRRYRLDELPQLWNILKGDISIVGPRPERPELTAEYKKIWPDFDLRLKVKGGLTGFAQVYGQYSTRPDYKLLMDLFYIENFSYLLDIRIFLMTLKSVFHKGSSE